MKAPTGRERESRIGLVGGCLMILVPVLTSVVTVSTNGPACLMGSPCQNTAGPYPNWVPTLFVWIVSDVVTVFLSLMLKAAGAKRRSAIGLALSAIALVYLAGEVSFVAYEVYSVQMLDPVLVSLGVSALCLGPLLVLVDGILILTRRSYA